MEAAPNLGSKQPFVAGLLSGAGVYNSRLSHSNSANFSISSVDKRPKRTSLMRLPPLELGSTRRGRAAAGGAALMVCCSAVLCATVLVVGVTAAAHVCAAVSFVTMAIASFAHRCGAFLRASLAVFSSAAVLPWLFCPLRRRACVGQRTSTAVWMFQSAFFLAC